MKKHLRIIYFLLLLGLNVTALKAQTAFVSEEELKKQALKLFEEDQFEDAYPLYTQLTSNYPKDPNYNYRLGVCMLYASEDKEKPISYLEFASQKQGVDKEVLFYLAKAYHLNYRFDDAINKYKAYKKVASSARAEKLQVDRQIEMCNNGKKLLHNLTDLVVIDKKEMRHADFFRAYDVSGIGGKLLVKPDEEQFKTALDKKKKETSIIYLSSDNNQIYFSSYGTDPERGKDIYVIRRLPPGAWSAPQTLGYPINTEFDEDYPFLHPNGKVLYFCSKGHNSMGGYDIFKSILNEETGTWNKPVNMDFPINTPDDDILYVTTEDEKEAYFSSARSSASGQTAVYHIKSDRRAIDKAIIKGNLVKNREHQSSDIKITVKDMKDNSILGIFNSKTDGGYFITLPNGGKFLFTVESPDFTTQSEMVSLPVQSSFTPLKQEISYDTGTDKLAVKNLFDQTAEDDAGYLSVLSLIKEKSRLEVNVNDVVDNTPPSSADTVTTPNQPANAVPLANGTSKKSPALSNDDIIKIAYADAKDADTEAKEAQEQADIALSLANQNNESAQAKTKEVKQLFEDVAKTTDNSQKQTATDQANAASKEAEQLNSATVAAFNIAKKLEKSAATKQQEADLSLKYAKDLETAVKAKNSTDALTKLDDQKQKLEVLSQEKTSADDIVSSLKIDSDTKQRELTNALQATTDIKQEITDNITLMGNVQQDADKTKNEQLKKGLTDQIADLKQENIDKQKELEQSEIKVARLQKEFNGIKNETELVNTVIDRSKNGTNETAAASVVDIDKNKLEQQVNTIKNATPTTPDIPAVAAETLPSATNKAKVDVETLTKVNQKYNDNLTAVEKIENVSEREKTKADVLKKWSEEIDTEVTKQKQDFIAASDPETKSLLANSITTGQQLSKEKQTQADESLAKVETLKQQEIIAVADKTTDTIAKTTNTTSAAITETTNPANAVVDNKTVVEDTVALVKLNQEYNENIVSAEKIENAMEREKTKAEVLKKWAGAIDTQVAKEKQDFINATDPETKTLLANSISDGEQLSKEKQMRASESLAKAETLKQQNNAAENSVVAKPIVETPIPANPTNVAATTTIQDTINGNKNNGDVSEKQFIYTMPSAVAQVSRANILTKQAADLKSQSNELKSKAETQTVIEERNATYAQADEVTKQAENKKIEAATVIAAANKTEFTTNQNRLDQIAEAAAANPADDLSMAEMMKDEAKIYFDKAQKLRTDAGASDTYYLKEMAFDEAYTNEMMALEKQKNANDIYKKYNSNFVAANATKPAVTSNPIVKTTPKTTPAVPTNTVNPVVINNKTTDVKDLTTKNIRPNDTLMIYSNPPLIRDSTTDNNQIKNNPSITPSIANAKNTATTKTVTNVNPSINKQSAVTLASNEKFEKKSIVEYSAAKPIPVNEKLPEGLIFKVQIGAFRNPIPQNLFNGMAPITGETTPQGFTRYTAGVFVKFPTADKVKNEIRNLGYKDAFVVAFLNGKRIPINEALTLAGIDPSSVLQTSSTPTNATTLISNGTTPVANNSTTQPVNPDAAPTQNVSVVNGLFYTVQIGVYSQVVTADKLHNIQPLYSETTANGMLRYNTGVYNNVPRAVEAKNMAINAGINDAFVTAYYNGKRILMSEASLLTAQGANVFSAGLNVNALPTLSSGRKTNIQQPAIKTINTPQVTTNTQQLVTKNEQPVVNKELKAAVAKNNPMQIDPGVVFKVQIGAFKDEVPIDIANKFLQIADKGIKNYSDEKGLTVYTVGNFKSYEEANKTKTDVIAEGIIDAFVVAYSDGKKITLDEAKQLINK